MKVNIPAVVSLGSADSSILLCLLRDMETLYALKLPKKDEVLVEFNHEDNLSIVSRYTRALEQVKKLDLDNTDGKYVLSIMEDSVLIRYDEGKVYRFHLRDDVGKVKVSESEVSDVDKIMLSFIKPVYDEYEVIIDGSSSIKS